MTPKLHLNHQKQGGMFTPTEKAVAIIGNSTTWLIASVAQDFMWIAAGICSLTTSIYMFTKLFILLRDKDKQKPN